MLVTRRKRKNGFAKWAAFPAQALLVSGAKVQVNEHPRAGFGTWELLVKP
jgi:hypothetical protein